LRPVVAEASVVWPGDEQLRGEDRADSSFVEELRHACADVLGDLAFELLRR